MYCVPVLVAILATQGKHKRPSPTDKWADPIPRIYGAADGVFALKVIPREGKTAQGTLFSVGSDGSENPVWNRQLENVPVEAYLSGDGHVATVDNWGGKGKAHSLVLYDRTGKTVADFTLKALFPDVNPRRNAYVLVTPSSNHWTVNADLGYVDPISIRNWSTEELAFADQTQSGLLFRIKTGWGETVLIDPDTGKILNREHK